MRVLALDHGTVRCGAAVSDPTETLVRPLSAISPPDPQTVAALATEIEAELIVVGLPLTLRGEVGAQAELAREFAAQVRERAEVPVTTWDERLTTAMADRSSRSGARADRDSLAAAHLLESFLNSRQKVG